MGWDLAFEDKKPLQREGGQVCGTGSSMEATVTLDISECG